MVSARVAGVDEGVEHPELHVFDVGRFEVVGVQLAHHAAPARLRVGQPSVGIQVGVEVVGTPFGGIEGHVHHGQRAGRVVAGLCAVGIQFAFIHFAHVVVRQLVQVAFDVCGGERRALPCEKRIDGVPAEQGAVVARPHVVHQRALLEVGRHTGNHPAGGLHHADAVFRVFEIIDVGGRALYLPVLSRDELGKLAGETDLRGGGHVDERDFVNEVGEPLAFLLPREVDAPKGVLQRFLAHVHLGGERLFVEEHEGAAQREVLAHVVLQVEAHERLALHAVVVVAFEVHTHVGARVDDALVDDGHHAHGIVHRVVLVFHQRHAACRHCHGALRHVHRPEADFRPVVALVFAREQEFVFFRDLPGRGFSGRVKFVKAIFLGQGVVVQVTAQVAAERFHHGEIDAPFVDGVAFHVVEPPVGVGFVVVVQTIQVHNAQELHVLVLCFGQIGHIHARRVALVLNVELEVFLLRRGGVQAIHVFHHQVPIAHVWRVRGVLQRLDEKGLGVVGQVRGELAHLVGGSAVGVFESDGQHFVRLEREVERHVAECRVHRVFRRGEQACALQFLIIHAAFESRDGIQLR